MNTTKTHTRFALGAACAVLFSACGGGGGSSDSGISYTGITTPAVITAGNGKDIAINAFIGGSTGATFATLYASTTPTAGGEVGGTPSVTAIVQTLLATTGKIEHHQPGQVAPTRAMQSYPYPTLNGDCGGTFDYTTRYDVSSGAFNDTLTFGNYCDGGETLNGVITATGTLDLVTEEIKNATMSFANLSYSTNIESVALDGDIAIINPTATTTEATTNMRIKDTVLNKVYWAKDYVTTINTLAGGHEIGITGRFYNPDYGYVNLQTPTPIYTADSDEWPSDGVMIATGDSNKKVRITALSNTTYTVEVDANGDGNYESQQNNLLWSDL